MDEDTCRYVDREIRHLKEIVERRAEATEKALELQAREYERRLEVLNHAHANAIEASKRTVSNDVYKADMRAMNERITATRERVLFASGAVAVVVVIVTWIIQLIIRGVT